jgi:hypothetical protein
MSAVKIKSLTIAPTHNRAVQQELHRQLNHLKEREAIRASMPQAFSTGHWVTAHSIAGASEAYRTRGGQYGTFSTTTFARALTQAVVIAYAALRDGAQTSDLAHVPALYPEVVAIVANAHTMTVELGELDTEDILELAGELVNLTQIVTAALANSELDEEEFTRVYGDGARDGQAITPDGAYHAARESLSSTHDAILVIFHALKDGFSIVDFPALVKLYPEATSLAVNAPLALKGWRTLTRKQRVEVGKLAIDIVENIWATLVGDGTREEKVKPPQPPNPPQGSGSGMQ